jgi:transposase
MHSISDNLYNLVISLLQEGETVREVAKTVGVSISTVSRIGQKECSDRILHKGGRRQALSAADKRYCVRMVTKGNLDNAVKVKKMLEKDHEITVSADTVRRALRGGGLGAIEKPKKPLLSKANVRKRIAWCKAHKDWTVDDWKRVVWSDETKINRFNSDGRVWAWIRDGETLSPKHVKVTVKHGGGSIMLWSALTYVGTGWMCKIDGNMDKTLYKEILEDEQSQTIDFVCRKLSLQRDQVVFQHDNDPKHTSNLVKDYLKEQDYKIMEWPPQSPDLNPIENMWQLLKIRLNEFETPPKGVQELYERVTKVWYDVITKEECQKCIESMPKRIKMCLKNKGYWTDY